MNELRLKILHYLATNGGVCLHCGSENLTYDSSDTEGQRVVCGNCGWSWYDCFCVNGVVCVEDEKGNEACSGINPFVESDVNPDDLAKGLLYKEIGGKKNLPTAMGISPALDEYIENMMKEM